MVEYSAHELNRRLTALHPKARRQLAAMTDSTYRPHNLDRQEPAEYRFLGLHWATWPIMAVISAAGWLASLPL